MNTDDRLHRTEERLRDLMAAYHTAASADPVHVVVRPARGRGWSARPRWVAAGVVATAAVLIVGVVTQRHWGGSTVNAGTAGDAISAPTVNAYADAIRAPYQQLFAAGETWWYVPPKSTCRVAALEWLDAARQQCQADDASAADAARRLAAVLASTRPPSGLASVHRQLTEASRALGLAFAAQVDDLIRADQQAFLDRAVPISDALGSLCTSVTALNVQVRHKLPVDHNWCTG